MVEIKKTYVWLMRLNEEKESGSDYATTTEKGKNEGKSHVYKTENATRGYRKIRLMR